MKAYPGLTARQADAMRFIDQFIKCHGYSPSYAEIGEGIGVPSKAGAHRIVWCLERRGYVTLLKHQARSILVVNEPDRRAP